MKKLLRNLLLWVLDRYDGATWDPDRSYRPNTYQSARKDAGGGTRIALVKAARDFEQNNPIFNKLIDLLELYTVGSGLQLSPASSNPQWNADAKVAWDGWCRYCDLTSRVSFGTLQGLAARIWGVDGEAYIILTRGESTERGQNGRPRIQLVEGHMLETPPHLKHLEGDTIIDGIGVDRNGRPVSYYFFEEAADGTKVWGPPKAAAFVIPIGEPNRPGMMRPLPLCYPIINELHDLSDLHDLEMKAARDAAEITNVISNEIGEMDASTMRRLKVETGNTVAAGTAVPESRTTYYQNTAGGRTVVLKTGDKLDQHRSERPSVVTQEYFRYKTELVCAGFGIPYILVFPSQMQGTVYRGALDMANAFFKARSLVLQDAFRRVYEYVMADERVRNPKLRDGPGDWMAVTIHPPRAVNVDVGRNSSAMLAELLSGATNFDLIYGPLGLDWREEFRKLDEQLGAAAKMPNLSKLFKMAFEPAPEPEPEAKPDEVPT